MTLRGVSPGNSSGISRIPLVSWGVAACLFLAGCGSDGPEKHPVSGVVRADGEPIETGSISFIPQFQDGFQAGASIVNGEYSVPRDKGLKLGKHQVQIRATTGTGEMLHPGFGAPNDARVERRAQFIPPKYNSRSVLTADIEAGNNEDTNFDLETGQ